MDTKTMIEQAIGDNLATAAKYYIKRYDTQIVMEQIKALEK